MVVCGQDLMLRFNFWSYDFNFVQFWKDMDGLQEESQKNSSWIQKQKRWTFIYDKHEYQYYEQIYTWKCSQLDVTKCGLVFGEK